MITGGGQGWGHLTRQRCTQGEAKGGATSLPHWAPWAPPWAPQLAPRVSLCLPANLWASQRCAPQPSTLTGSFRYLETSLRRSTTSPCHVVAAPPRQHLLLRPILLLLFRLLLRVLAEAKERTRGRGRSAPRPPARRGGGGGWWEGRRGAGSGAAGAAALRARSAEEAANRAAAPGEPLTLLPPPGVRWRSSASAVALAWLPLLQTGSEIQDLGASSPSRPAHLAQNGLDGLQAAFRAIGCECCCPGRF